MIPIKLIHTLETHSHITITSALAVTSSELGGYEIKFMQPDIANNLYEFNFNGNLGSVKRCTGIIAYKGLYIPFVIDNDLKVRFASVRLPLPLTDLDAIRLEYTLGLTEVVSKLVNQHKENK